MHRSNRDDEPTRAGHGGSTSAPPRRCSTRNAQSNRSAASTPSIPGRPINDPPPQARHRRHRLRRVSSEAESETGPRTAAAANDTALATPNDREATELAPLPSSSSSSSSSPSSRSWDSASQRRVVGGVGEEEVDEDHQDVPDDEPAGRPRPLPPPSEAPTCTDECSVRERRKLRLTRQEVGWWDVATRWWRRQVSVTVPAGGMRDHLALERTFLGYLRTSIALSMTGVMIAQLMRLQHAPNPDPRYGYHALGKPLAAVFITAAIAVLILGAFRFWRQQNAIVRGKVFAGGWEILAIMIGSTILTTTVFGLLLAVDIKKALEGSG
ncbi:uncharacterized protein BKCO1_8000022 [Diplodia corticola]|uniref:DUF202 domain-containing protein n=1 Tax=Diplodia corticola TaxID=236234 RepID=A0A1J9RLQ8_9PEZI|nr:uncharacterized protein BKCO1_8000022 [Diplodia corticola]OJD29447.1 hypothetical protein BKCO1_8000022 [Diplodia corticola]